MKRFLLICFVCCCVTATLPAQGLTDMSRSSQAQMHNLPMGAVRWTGGFWGDVFDTMHGTGVWEMWNTWNTPWETLDADGKHGSHGFRNFEVAAGTVKGKHHGPPFHDGDMYKWLEACAAVYAVTKDGELDALMDRFIEQVALAQRADGYIHTPVVISERNAGIDSHAGTDNAAGIEIGKDQAHAFASRLNFETYNLGHLMTAGIVHKRATGKTTLFDCGRKAADFLYNFLTNDAAELSRNAICPSHYMGATEMYRETGDPKYLELAKGLIAIRDSVTNGEDHNQDRHKFRDQYEAMGHAVRANYLYAGVADLYAETGEAQLLKNLTAIWDDIVNHKIYIMGGCGALYDGVSPDGTTYDQPSIQQIHQAYGRQFQLPQEAAHNEICAQIGMMLFSWRMFQTTVDPKYIDNIENELYNGILSGISLDGKDFFYTEALRRTKEFPYVMRWPKHRQRYISCFCCPPNTLRTLCEAQEYAYSINKDTLWVNLYGQNALKTKDLEIEQETNYPWDGHIRLTIKKAKNLKSIRMHIPGWSTDLSLKLNGEPILVEDLRQPRPWKKGDVIELELPMPVRLVEANPLVEEAKNQVAIMRGPIVYCLEGQDIANGVRINNIAIPADAQFTEVPVTIAGTKMLALETDALLTGQDAWDNNTLYRELRPVSKQKVKIRLIPYYAWDNRGIDDMSLWLPLAR
ncbi:MAG: glycoside hydrolase family 127 protein [Prevotella sp.]|nr:glycoside hydrolase family 127 protein [Prevotella sp.]